MEYPKGGGEDAMRMKSGSTRSRHAPFGFVTIPQPLPKPRELRWTVLSDRSVPMSVQRDHLEVIGDIVDRVKIGDHIGMLSRLPWQFYVKKNQLYRKYGLGTFPGGMTFEVIYLQNKVEMFFDRLAETGFSGVEISAACLPGIPHKKRAALIGRARNLGLEVFTETGNKVVGDSLGHKSMRAGDMITAIRQDLEAGANKVTIENNELLQYMKSGRSVLLRVVDKIGLEPLIFEVGPGGWPGVSVWLLDALGPDINVENIDFDRVAGFEAMRRGLHRLVDYPFFAQHGAKKTTKR
jgi:phosphosulfolactate synthase